MPPQITADESGSDLGDLQHDESRHSNDEDGGDQLNDVPEADEHTKPEDDHNEGSDEEEEEAAEEDDQYQVESIVKHKFEGKTLKYFIKWVGYADSENTWEPEANLLPHAREILSRYHVSIGGIPQRKSLKKSKSTPSLKRQSTEQESPTPASKRQRKTNSRAEDTGTGLPAKEDWEAEVDKVDLLERDPMTMNLFAYIKFKNGRTIKVTMDQVYQHCPRPMLRYYEDHLKFK